MSIASFDEGFMDGQGTESSISGPRQFLGAAHYLKHLRYVRKYTETMPSETVLAGVMG